MKRWVDLYRAHRDARRLGSEKWDKVFRMRLIKLAEHGYCEPNIQGRFTYGQNPKRADLVEWSIRPAPLALHGVPHLASAKLSLMALTDRSGHLHMFTVTVEGERDDGSKWTLAVHLPDDQETARNPKGDRQGRGAGGHAALHCHVGPDLETAPEVRVPLPAISAAEALDWVLSQIITTDDFEPALWPDVQTALKKASA
jgi:hypothetical protein